MGHFAFDFKRMEFRRAGEVVKLSKVKQKLLQVLVQNRGRTFPWAVLAQLVWPEDTEPSAFLVTLKELLDRYFYPAILESFGHEENQRAFMAGRTGLLFRKRKAGRFPRRGTSCHTPYIDSFFQAGCVLRGAPFFFS